MSTNVNLFFNEDKKEERQYKLYQVSTYKEIKLFVDFFSL